MKRIKEHIIYYYFSYLLSLTSVAYGWTLVAHPEILQTYKVYQDLRVSFDHRFIGLLFIVLGLSYGLSTMANRKRIKQLLLPVFSFIWTFFSFSFILSDPPNTVGILTLCVALIGFGISVRGDLKDG
ncbi:hypothetical protein [Aerococcus urinaeequi]|uniref:hypothetical protein n=1 Tax=Aerococcus urinaeequi TaxID=51665 RepID=UPI003EC63A96